MALYQNITITDAGAELISGIILNGGSPLTFEAVAVGSGELAEGATTAAFTGLIKEAKRLPIETVTQQGGIITVTARLATDTITADLYHREVGVYANGVLLAYGNTGDKYDYIPTAGNNAAVQKIIRVPLSIGTMQATFAEMDTTDLVTHAALEARVKTVVEPIVREITVDMAKDALNEAVHDVAKEVSEAAAADAYAAQVKAEEAAAQALVSETNIDTAIEEAMQPFNEHNADNVRHLTPEVQKNIDSILIQTGGGSVSTGASTHEMAAYAFRIDSPPAGKCEKITLNISSNAAEVDTNSPFYLVVLEDDGQGNYSAIAISQQRQIQIVDSIAEYTFSNLILSGAKIKLAYSQDKSMSSMPDKMGLKVTDANGKGLAYTDKALSVTENYIPALTFKIASIATAFYKNDVIYTLNTEDDGVKATGWIWVKDNPGVPGELFIRINYVDILIPEYITGEAIAAAINAANAGVTATSKAVPSSLGSGGLYFEIIANEPGSKGNLIRLESPKTGTVTSGAFMTGGTNGTTPKNTADALLQVARDVKMPINARRLFAESDIEEIPAEYDLSQVIFAFQMCQRCYNLRTLENVKMRSVMNITGMCQNCTSLITIRGSYFSYAIQTDYAFNNCPNLAEIGDAAFENAMNAGAMFQNCPKIKSTGTSTFQNLMIANYMFDGCTSLEDITSMLFTRVIAALYMFRGCILNLASVKHISNTISKVAGGNITIGINAELQGNSELTTALETIRGKGWTVNEEYNTKTA